jgi:cytochrome c556
MTKQMMLVAVLFMIISGPALSKEMKHEGMNHKLMHKMKMDAFSIDSRVSLNLSPMMKQHQLKNMRAHLDAVRQIILFIAEDDFDAASKVASKQLGSNKKMMKMCNSFDNEAFKSMGMVFHKSGDELAKTLKKGELQSSLRALNQTMTSCVSCHTTFRQ